MNIQNQEIETAFAKMQSAIDLLPEDKRHRAQKQLDIVSLTYRTACSVTDTLSEIPATDKKRIFPFYDRTPAKRYMKLQNKQKAKELSSKAMMTVYQSAFTAQLIASRPQQLKRFESGNAGY